MPPKGATVEQPGAPAPGPRAYLSPPFRAPEGGDIERLLSVMPPPLGAWIPGEGAGLIPGVATPGCSTVAPFGGGQARVLRASQLARPPLVWNLFRNSRACRVPFSGPTLCGVRYGATGV
jgi:hypothetical protein